MSTVLCFFGFRIGLAEGLHGDGGDDLVFDRTVAVIRRGGGNAVDGVHALGHFTECRILAVQMGRVLVHDKELGTGGVGMHGACHGEDAGRVAEVIGEAVGGEFTWNAVAGAAGAGPLRAAALDHESGNDSVKDQSVVKP